MTMNTPATARAFTLVETLVAISILTLAILGPYEAAQHALIAAYTARDELIASSLAQEGVEYVRSQRDANYLGGQDWLTGLTACLAPQSCGVDPENSTTVPAPVPPLRLQNDGSYAQQGTAGTVTPFTRSVTITPVGGATEVLVAVTVSWSSRGAPHAVTVNEHLTNWQ
jgi:Tfp pilus assembly protein PilV